MSRIMFVLNDKTDTSFSVETVMWRICKMMGIVPNSREFEHLFDFIKISSNTDTVMLLKLLYGRKIVIVGPSLTSILRTGDFYYGCWFDHPEEHILCSVIPEPDGRNMLYNNPEMNEIIRSFLSEVWRNSEKI